MPDNDLSNEITSLEQLLLLHEVLPHIVFAWIYPKVMAALRHSFKDVHESELQDAFHDAAQGFEAAMRKAEHLEDFIKLASRRAKWRLLSRLRRREKSVNIAIEDEGGPVEAINQTISAGVEQAKAEARHQFLDELRPEIVARLTPTEVRHLELLENGFTHPEVSAKMHWTVETSYARRSALLKKVRTIVKKLELFLE